MDTLGGCIAELHVRLTMTDAVDGDTAVGVR